MLAALVRKQNWKGIQSLPRFVHPLKKKKKKKILKKHNLFNVTPLGLFCQLQAVFQSQYLKVAALQGASVSNCRAGKDKLKARHGSAVRSSESCMKSHLQGSAYKRKEKSE